MRQLCHAVLSTGLFSAVVACASSPAATGDSVVTEVEGAETSRSRDELVWTGALQPTQERTGYAAQAQRNKAYGTVRLKQSAEDPSRTSVNIVISTPLQDPAELRWAILPGRCGSTSLPIMGYDHFPIIEVGTNGRGTLTAEIPLALPYNGSFHVNIYWGDRFQPGSARLQDVLTCANLRRAG